MSVVREPEVRRREGLPHQSIVHMKDICKSFSGVRVLRGINLTLYQGEVHALMGENGAGKSTLMKIISGIHRPDSGRMVYKNAEVTWNNPQEARNRGISVIHQEISLSPNLTIGENILMGTKLPKNAFGLIKWNEIHEKAEAVLQSIGSPLNPRMKVSALSVAQQQIVEIARALSFNSEVLIMDEPTASLTDKEIDKLFGIIEDLKRKGVAIVYISHRMDEIFRISDRCTVMRDGQYIASMPIAETNPDHLVKLMVGRELTDLFQRKAAPHAASRPGGSEPVLELVGVSDRNLVRNVSLKLFPGEIVGLAGLVGAGRTELLRTIFGVSRRTSGQIYLEGVQVQISSPNDAIGLGIAHVPESRKEQGLFPNLTVKENIMMNRMHQYRKARILRYREMDAEVERYIQELGVKTATSAQNVMGLSGGNQQKVVIARWLSIGPKVLLLDEPTRGVDVGAKTEIHKIICELAAKGLAVLMVSSELPEILGVSDRILVMHEGRIAAELSREEATQEKIMYYATGESKE
ncbi:sugar ABC transporter ATP-binding protein [Paenibacillus mucilaginosus]|uniref:Ribose transport ATP-binding protein RbsA n=3 Tax=Paenibacillus mucilaginosus TaxID=61624 RepID=H6NJB1_9BACL|nr:sugar ABC transporter ATP-binding protein [Paenibacillus mucilaginosus]AEI40567.1 ribose transport ATP-binding protein RbsA [Paenibacillus mucilaginosus KNP414]AFC29190.1 ribose transport ATP-binding protein RbsA [Paenibacillus mucilaginosus 3016]AFH61363.1 D-ribose transporter ATP binding protein [Paenibacillus mucilaginosus K02]MCG7216299.1 sugar ABC transporter ATP-binding protein [Paenibacillus mucilaginosus]WDM29725.1 sugar ABC transporter ATP-binding protein [Paenibacillus mucilaginos